MSSINLPAVIGVIIIGIGILFFVIRKNQKDKKELESEGMEDIMGETRNDQDRNHRA